MGHPVFFSYFPSYNIKPKQANYTKKHIMIKLSKIQEVVLLIPQEVGAHDKKSGFKNGILQ